jgi:Rieske Fe-S protein
MDKPERRTFLEWTIHGLGTLFAAVLGIPAVGYLIDGRNRPERLKDYRPVDGIKLSELEVGKPRQGIIRNIRQDAWTLHLNDVVGRVWVIKSSDNSIQVFTTVCPHLGCSINFDQSRTCFLCPCHGAEFNSGGFLVERSGYQNPAPRAMDSLDWRRDPANEDLIQVIYLSFYQGRHEKEAKT